MRFSVNNYYATLSSAITDLNTNSFAGALLDPVGAKVQVIRGCDGTYTVRLLDALSENVTIEVNKNIVLDLNGKALAFTAVEACLTFGAGTNCVINGKDGSVIKDLEGEITDASFLICADGSSLKVNGGTYFCHCDTSSQTMVFRGSEGSGHLTLESCAITAENNVSQAKSIQSQAAVTDVVNCTVTANGQGVAYGVFVAGETTVTDSIVATNSVDQYAISVRNMNGHLSVLKSELTATAEKGLAYALQNTGGDVTTDGSNFIANSGQNNVFGIALEYGSADVTNCGISAVSAGVSNVTAWGIYTSNGTVLNVTDSHIDVDARPHDDVTWIRSVAVTNNGTASLNNVMANASYTAVWNNGNLYVNGGEYQAYTYGGFVLNHGAEGTAFINDAVLRGGTYSGQFQPTSDYYSTSTIYLIGAYTKAYMDGCTCDATFCHRSIVIRGDTGEHHNALCISNSTVDDGTLNRGAIRIDNDTMMLSVGIGTNIDSTKFKNGFTSHDENGTNQIPADYETEGVVEYTGQLYRQVPDSHICNGKDYDALRQWMSMQTADT